MQNVDFSSDSAEEFLTLAQGVRQRGMPARDVTVDRETPPLLPPDLGDWGPTLASIAPAADPGHEVLIDSGFCS